ncbi:MAG: thermonuclease family protein [Candidatus Cloacimonetes bacterium]|nr:thermonuclease family protein [Candidatus Cloacimonadota bacterium]
MRYRITKKSLLSMALGLIVLLAVRFLSAKEIRGQVVSIQDGDTITVLQGRTTCKVRLAAVDCPEKGQAFGNVARQFTSDLVFGKAVKVKYEELDRYNRYLGTVYIGGKNLNKELLKAGLAWHYKQYSKDPVLAALEVRARQDRKGLWSDPKAIPPWEFRHLKREKA